MHKCIWSQPVRFECSNRIMISKLLAMLSSCRNELDFHFSIWVSCTYTNDIYNRIGDSTLIANQLNLNFEQPFKTPRWHINKRHQRHSINIFIGVFLSKGTFSTLFLFCFFSSNESFVFCRPSDAFSFSMAVPSVSHILCEYTWQWMCSGNQFLFDHIDISFRCKIDWVQSIQQDKNQSHW